MYSATALGLMATAHEAYSQEMISEGETPRKLDPMILLSLFQLLLPMIPACNKTPPTPPPVPDALVDQGVTKAQWTDASDSKWLVTENWNAKKRKYNAAAVREASRRYREKHGGTVKEAKAQVIGGFTATRTSSVEDFALTMVNALAMQE